MVDKKLCVNNPKEIYPKYKEKERQILKSYLCSMCIGPKPKMWHSTNVANRYLYSIHVYKKTFTVQFGKPNKSLKSFYSWNLCYAEQF